MSNAAPIAGGTAPPARPLIRPRASLLLLGYLAFVSLGLPDGLLGVGWPSISADFQVPAAAVGLLLTAGTAGYLTSSVIAGFAVARIGIGWLLAGSTALMGLALAGYAGSPVLAVMVGCALVAGLGSGAIDSGLNAYAASAFGPRHMNWIHAFFGLGVAGGPMIMTATLDSGLGWRWGYGTVALAQAGLAVAFMLNVRSWAAGRPAAPAGDAADAGGTGGAVPIGRTLRLPAVWLGALAFAVYVAVEIGAGLWAYTVLTTGRNMGTTAAGMVVTLYWGSLFVGRVVQGFVAERQGTRGVLRASLLGMVVGAGVLAVPGPGWLAAVGLAVLGFAAAPVFPLLTLTTADRVGAAHADRVIGVQIASAGLGGALIPAGIGVLLGWYGPVALGPTLLVLSAVLTALYLLTERRPAAPPPSARAL
ncbi:sugar MFS transporter [Plantactinospora sp. KBS50]|uniref:MFS transporter n=1 Tax=Plantactinospora sp. KBS50 TaxID=2024580 RepID=UPI000BAAC071|nr:MFS transporter [Plantactinospora sp. KBS50]ASW54571.1 MFS transporter [Plantactinospora sp. KBS50]